MPTEIPGRTAASKSQNATPPQNSRQRVVNQSVDSIIARVKNELQKVDEIKPIKILRGRLNVSLRAAKDAVEALNAVKMLMFRNFSIGNKKVK